MPACCADPGQTAAATACNAVLIFCKLVVLIAITISRCFFFFFFFFFFIIINIIIIFFFFFFYALLCIRISIALPTATSYSSPAGSIACELLASIKHNSACLYNIHTGSNAGLPPAP
jgi:hypothetical protein